MPSTRHFHINHNRLQAACKIILCAALFAMLLFPQKAASGRPFSFLFHSLFPILEVQAGEVGTDGYLHATNLAGTSYALLTKDNTLYLFRTSEQLDIGSSYTYTQDGKSYTGIIKDKSLETESHTLYEKASKIVFLDDIQPQLLSFSGSNASSIEGMEHHLDTSNMTDMSGMFQNCSKLASLDVSHFDTRRVTKMGFLFAGCTKLTEIDTSRFQTGNVREFNNMFQQCSGLTSLDVSHFDIKSAVCMNSMFSGCTGLTSLNVSGWDTGNVTEIGSMFEQCINLETLNVSHFNTSMVFNFSNTFKDCAKLTSLDVSAWNTENATIMGGMFYGCKGLTSLDVSGFRTGKVTTFRSMFQGCAGLAVIDVSGFDTKKADSVYAMFSGCTKVTTLDVSGFQTDQITDMSFLFNECSALQTLDVSNFNTANVTSMRQMFAGCSKITSLDVSGFETGNVTDMYWMFQNCSSVPVIDVSSFDTAKVTTMSNMFYNCSKLTELDVSGFDTGSVTDMSRMFYGCSKLTALDVSHFNTRNVFNMSSMFMGASQLTQIDASGFDTSQVTNMYAMFTNCSRVTKLDVSGFHTEKVKNMSYMFAGCSNAAVLDTSTFVTSNVTNMSNMFKNCQKISYLDLSGFDTGKVTSMDSMFLNCSKLSALRLGDKTTLQNNCSLRDLPSSDKYTGKWALNDPYNHDGSVTTKDLIAKSQEEGKAPGLWTAEKPDRDPYAQKYVSISDNIYHPSEHTNQDGTTKQGEDPVTIYRKDTGNSGYWQKISEDQWAYTFFVYKNNETNWKLWEEQIPGYTGSNTEDNPLKFSGAQIQQGEQPVITNTDGYEMKYGSLSLQKKVVDTKGAAFKTDAAFVFTIHLFGDHIEGQQLFGETPFSDGVATIRLQNGESVVFSGIPEGTTYQITEKEENGYTSVIDKPDGMILANDMTSVLCTNTKQEEKDPPEGFVSFSVQKNVISNADETQTLFTFYAAFTGLEPGKKYETSKGETFTADGKGCADLSFSLKQGETDTFTKIPVGATYVITEAAGEYIASYQITDKKTTGTIVSSTGKNSQINTALSTQKETADKGEEIQIVFTNKITRTQDVVLTKESVLADGRTDTSDTTQYVIDVLLTGLAGGQSIQTSNGILKANEEGAIENSMYITPNQRVIFSDLPVGTSYQFTEKANGKIASYQIVDEGEMGNIVSQSGGNDEEKTDLATEKETVDAGEQITVTFTNTSLRASKLQVIKYDNTEEKNKLGGAEFALYKADGTPVNFTADGSNAVTIGAGGESKVLESPLFVEGSYYLVETKAPDGYTVNGEPKAFQITAADAGKILQIEVYDDKLVVFPVTGGEGNRYILAIACILAAASLAMVIYKKRQRATS